MVPGTEISKFEDKAMAGLEMGLVVCVGDGILTAGRMTG